jgi:hypothetical protein
MPLDPERLRGWVYDALLRPAHEVGANSGGLQLRDISQWVKQKAQQSGSLAQDTLIGINNLDRLDEDAIRECIWSLIIQGIVVPGVSNDAYSANLPWVQVTEWGRACLRAGEYTPYDTGVFLGRLKKLLPSLDSGVEFYLKEALNSFRSGNYLATAVMTGVASERVLLLLRDTILHAIQEPDRKRKFTEATQNQIARRIYEAIAGRIDPIREQLPAALQDSIGTELDGIFNEIRRTRNDAGHPTGRVIERSEAYALLQLFPVYAKSAYALLDWLKTNAV